MTVSAPLHVFDEDLGLSVTTLQKALWLLKPRELKAYLALIVELKDAGQLPTGLRSLAERAHVSAASFEKMAETLGSLFARDAAGRWTDHGVMQARGKRAVLPAQELQQAGRDREASP